MPDGLCKVGWGSGHATRPLGRVFGGGEGVALVVRSGKQECSTPDTRSPGRVFRSHVLVTVKGKQEYVMGLQTLDLS